FDPAGLADVLREWNSAANYSDRVAHLTGMPGGQNGSTVLSAATVSDDGAKDVLTGGLDADWFVLSVGDVLDRKDPEQALII
ncbi:MAG TPA: hypothetical protein VKD90_05300, partial [Gemmataceae bacterium]|nr:hypothetical protein [Gemmataceae bacterium]